MTDSQKPNPDEFTRIIVLIYGLLENGNPFWVYAAVKPSQYKPFQAAHKDKKLDLYKFSGFGEIIVSGEGKAPPDEITLKVAEMYQTDPATMFKPIDVEKEVYARTTAMAEERK